MVRRRLALVVPSPALHVTTRRVCARVSFTSSDGHKILRRRRFTVVGGRPVRVVPKAVHVAGIANCAREEATSAHVDEVVTLPRG